MASQAGFFGWLRDEFTEEVPESHEIPPPTFHEQPYRAEETLRPASFEADSGRDRRSWDSKPFARTVTGSAGPAAVCLVQSLTARLTVITANRFIDGVE
ncbi:MAG: hypothetical protein V5A56_16235, partial [Halolamina sp.]